MIGYIWTWMANGNPADVVCTSYPSSLDYEFATNTLEKHNKIKRADYLGGTGR